MLISENSELMTLQYKSLNVFIKREDLIHPFISGNKYRKLKYNLKEAYRQNNQVLLTFGGAYSNHIAAVAYLGKLAGFKTIGVIRGQELASELANNPTLVFAKKYGMRFKFITRALYKQKTSNNFLKSLQTELGSFYVIPEGGTNNLAIKGCEEILTKQDHAFDYICCPVGTGGTISGLINASQSHQTILGFPALKGGFLPNDIRKFVSKSNWHLLTDYTFGGYAKISIELVDFMNRFRDRHQILLDPIYTAKMMFGLFDLIDKNYFPTGAKILAIHTGGTQGIDGMNLKLKDKNWSLIKK